MKRIVLTGGGSAGHVTPNLALIHHLLKDQWEIHYIGTENGIERTLISGFPQVVYHSVKSGKLRRYMDVKNLTDPFKVMMGVGQSMEIIRTLKPRVIFSKGGFVSVPIVVGGWINRVPVVIHESDMTPGLANKIAIPFAQKVCTTFPETLQHIKEGKGIHTGTPIRQELFHGDGEKGRRLCGFVPNKPVVLMMGGSLGAVSINKVLRKILKKLTTRFQVVHICGKGNMDPEYQDMKDYKQFEYIGEELPHILAMADIIISRAGANSIYEFLALRKANLLIPLPLSASRGDQILNARSFEKQGFSKVLPQEELTEDSLYLAILDLYRHRSQYVEAMRSGSSINGVDGILEVIYSCL